MCEGGYPLPLAVRQRRVRLVEDAVGMGRWGTNDRRGAAAALPSVGASGIGCPLVAGLTQFSPSHQRRCVLLFSAFLCRGVLCCL